MLSAYHPTEDILITYHEYLEYTIGHNVQHRGTAPKARCPICNANMIIVAGKKKDDGHFRHESNKYCPTKIASAAPYQDLNPSQIDFEAVESNKEFVKENINRIWQRLKELVPFLNINEVVQILREAKRLNIYSYANVQPELIVYIYLNLINFLPSKSYKKKRKFKLLFFYQCKGATSDLWINRGNPSKLFRISYKDKTPLKVSSFESSTDYLTNDVPQAADWILRKLLAEV